jgi:N-terminal half of MaoC dehydratase
MAGTRVQNFKDAVEEFIRGTEQLLGVESPEDRPPPAPAPLSQEGPPVPSALHLTEDTIRRYVYSIGDDNPLYTDPAYARASVYGTPVAPGPLLVHVRYPADHGAARAQGYPVANFLAGVAWEFYDVLRAGSRFSSSKVGRESFEKLGAHGMLLFLVSESFYWDQSARLKGKAYGSLIHVPMESMAEGRAMPVDRLGQQLLYKREPYVYSEDEVRRITDGMAAERRRGAEPRWWEDVSVGERLPPIAQPPYTIQDEMAYHALHQGLFASTDRTRWLRAFGLLYRRGRREPSAVRLHPATNWPYTRADEHEDAFLAPYRGEPLPFDFGIQRAQVPHRLLANWMGDAGFVRKLYTCYRRPIFYGDAGWYQGTVTAKSRVTEEGDGSDGAPRSANYHAVTVSLEGTNQLGELHCEGYATLYLPSREHGLPHLPIPHPARPLYVPFARHRAREWFS